MIIFFMKNELEEELSYFNKYLNDMIEQGHEGKIVVIKGSEIFGYYNKRIDALAEGIRHYGNLSFLCKKVEKSEPIYLNLPIQA